MNHMKGWQEEDVVLRRSPVDWLKLRLTLQLPRLLVLQVGSKDYNRWKLQDGIFTYCTKTFQKIWRSFWELLLLKCVGSHTDAPFIGKRNLPCCLCPFLEFSFTCLVLLTWQVKENLVLESRNCQSWPSMLSFFEGSLPLLCSLGQQQLSNWECQTMLVGAVKRFFSSHEYLQNLINIII